MLGAIAGDIGIAVVGYITCDGCPGGNVEYAVDEMMRRGNGVGEVLAGQISISLNRR